MAMRRVVELVVNKTFAGSYSLSNAALRQLAERKGLSLTQNGDSLCLEDHSRLEEVVPRDDPDLLEIVREMGSEANGNNADLEIVKANVWLDIVSTDGYEQVQISGFEA